MLPEGKKFDSEDFDPRVLRYVRRHASPTGTVDLTSMSPGQHVLLTAEGTLAGILARVLVDSGATLNYVAPSLVRSPKPPTTTKSAGFRRPEISSTSS